MLVVLKSIITDNIVITYMIVCVDSVLLLENRCKIFNNNHQDYIIIYIYIYIYTQEFSEEQALHYLS